MSERAGGSVTLRPMREDELPAYRDALEADYARDMVENGGFPVDVAKAKAARDVPGLLSAGVATRGVEVLVVEEGGESVGKVILGEREREGDRYGFVYDIVIEPERRERGLGRAALELLEEHARTRGLHRIELNVFGGNTVARRLYTSLGYDESAVTMQKDL